MLALHRDGHSISHPPAYDYASGFDFGNGNKSGYSHRPLLEHFSSSCFSSTLSLAALVQKDRVRPLLHHRPSSSRTRRSLMHVIRFRCRVPSFLSTREALAMRVRHYLGISITESLLTHLILMGSHFLIALPFQ